MELKSLYKAESRHAAQRLGDRLLYVPLMASEIDQVRCCLVEKPPFSCDRGIGINREKSTLAKHTQHSNQPQ